MIPRRVPHHLSSSIILVGMILASGCGGDEGAGADVAATVIDATDEVDGSDGLVDAIGGQEAVDAVDALGLEGVARIVADQFPDVTGFTVDGDRVIFEHAAVEIEAVGMALVCNVANATMEAASEIVVEFPSGPQTCP